MTVQWGAVDCIHRNGDITGYSVRYVAQWSGHVQTKSVSGGGATQTIISGLIPSTNYSIEVAAVNSAGTGVYTDAVFVLTPGTLEINVIHVIVMSSYGGKILFICMTQRHGKQSKSTSKQNIEWYSMFAVKSK